jgi:hypothetical protein
MRRSRREFVKLLGIAVGAAAAGVALRDPLALAESSNVPSRLPLDPRAKLSFSEDLPALAALALDEASALGCEYADVRLDRCCSSTGAVESERCTVRVIDAGTWGVALSASLEEHEVARTSARALAAARTHAALGTEPFDVFRQCKVVASAASFRTEETYSTSTKGGHSRALQRFA